MKASNKKLRTSMEYMYFLANASLTLRVVKYLHANQELPVKFITLIYQIDGWVVNVKMKSPLNHHQDRDLCAFLHEVGIPFEPPKRVKIALWSLEAGESPSDVMCRYQVVIVSHGSPKQEEIAAFRQQIIKGLGYCPSTLA